MYDEGYSYHKSLAGTSVRMAPSPPGVASALIPTDSIAPSSLRYSPGTSPAAADVPAYMVQNSGSADVSAVYVKAPSEETSANDIVGNVYVPIVH